MDTRLPLCVLFIAVIEIVACQRVAGPEAYRWTSGPSLRTPRDDFGLEAVGHKLYAFGGMSGARGRSLRTTEVLDLNGGGWATGPLMGTPRSSFATAVVDGAIYVIGGANDRDTLDMVERLDPASGTWTRLASAPTRRYGSAAVALGQRIYVAGGFRDVEPLDTFEVYDVASGSWKTLSPMPTARGDLSLVLFDRKIYALGGSGRTQDGDQTRAVEVYDPATDRWTRGPGLPDSIVRGVAGVVGGQLHVMVSSKHFVLDPARGVWSRWPGMPTPRKGARAVVIDDLMYVVGGCSDSNVDVGVVERLGPR